MSRLAFMLFCLSVVLPAKAQIFSQGPPASATSPTADGRTHGAPASVLSPKPPPFLPGRGPFFFSGAHVRPFGTPRRRHIFVPVPVFSGIYGPGYDDSAYPSVADPAVDQSTDSAPAQSAGNDPGVASNEDALRQAYTQGVRDALAQQQADSRYGQHYLDPRESARPKPQPAESKPPASKPDPKPAADDSPATVFIFKDGHQIETRNFAIMGKVLYDFSSSSLKKVQLTDLDAAATIKANDDRGITVKLQ
ncbi:MAG TPA: hypothetical protein VI488_08085 [Candidatus Angelobacter sp.]